MKAPKPHAPELGTDDVVRFADLDHFLEELAGELGRGRAWVRSARSHHLQTQLMIGIEDPVIGRRVSANAVVVFVEDDLLGLKIIRFHEQVEDQLAALRAAAEASFLEPAAKTVVSPAPVSTRRTSDFAVRATTHGVAQIHFDEDDEGETGHISEPLWVGTSIRSTTRISQALLEPPRETFHANPPSRIATNRAVTPDPRAPTNPHHRPSIVSADYFRDTGEQPAVGTTDSSLGQARRLSGSHSMQSGPVLPLGPDMNVSTENLQVLAESHPALLRATPDGTLLVHDSETLLGLYLTQLRHGRVTVLDGPTGNHGQPVVLRMTGIQDMELSARVVARAGPWVTLELFDVESIQRMLLDDKATWRAALDKEFATPRATPSPPASTTPASPAPREPREEGHDDHQPPRLDGDRVLFNASQDLACELESHLASGGLFVQSEPLPIRQRRQLEVVVEGVPWGVRLEADVVFASGGRVGFSVINAGKVRGRLEELLSIGGGKRPEESADLSVDLSPHSAPRTADLSNYRGNLSPPLTNRQLLNLPRYTQHDLSDEPLPVVQIVEIIVRERWRGILTLSSNHQKLMVWFHHGDVAFVSSEPYDESKSLGRILIHQKKVNEGALREALDKSIATRRPLGRMLVALGSIRKSDLIVALREQTRLKLESAFAFEDGTFQWSPWEEEPPGDSDIVLTRGMSVMSRFIRHRLEMMNIKAVEALFGADLDRIVIRTPNIDITNFGLSLQPKELRFSELQIEGTRSIQAATLGSPVGRLASLRLIGLCLAVGLLQFADGGQLRAESSRAKSTVASGLERNLRDRLIAMERQNHFEVLGVHWSAHHRNYQEAWERARKEFGPDRDPIRHAPESVKNLAREALRTIEASFLALTNRDQRVRYRKELFDQTEREYAADMLVKQGEVALMRGDRVSAMECLETAVELNPSSRNRTLLVSAREGRS